MIYEIDGDITLTTADAIAHGVSPNDHFEAGLALALRELWPAMAKTFVTTRIKRTRSPASSGPIATLKGARSTISHPRRGPRLSNVGTGHHREREPRPAPPAP